MPKNVGKTAMTIAVGFGCGNFLWQVLKLLLFGFAPDWIFAFGITFFQWWALGYMWWRLRDA